MSRRPGSDAGVTRPFAARTAELLHIVSGPYVIALWLEHESTNTTRRDVEADLAAKEQVISPGTKLRTPSQKLRQFRASDSLMRFLQTLKLCIELAGHLRRRP